MKTILVPIEAHDLVTPVLEAALALGRQFGSYIEGLALSQTLTSFVAADALGAMMVFDEAGEHDPEAARAARQSFESFMQAHDVRRDTAAGEGVSHGWCDRAVSGDGFVGSYGRVFDITVVGRPGAQTSDPRMSTLETALFESGRPILMIPATTLAAIGETVLIAWNGSTETARAIEFALPLLRRARRTVVLSVEGGSVPGPTADQVARHLKRNGVAAESLHAKAGSRATGETILAEASRLEADLLVKGAFTQSRLRQMIFGGATRHVIAEANLPVLMAH